MVRLLDVWSVLTLLPGQSRECSKQDFARDLYLRAHAAAAINFELPDFGLYAVRPVSARFVAGFGRIVDLDEAAWAGLTRG